MDTVGWINLWVDREWGRMYTKQQHYSHFGISATLYPKQIYVIFYVSFDVDVHLRSCSTEGMWTSTHPGTLSSNKLVIFSLDTSPAASIIVLLFKVRIIFQLLWCLQQTQRQRKSEIREQTEIDSWKGHFFLLSSPNVLKSCPSDA